MKTWLKHHSKLYTSISYYILHFKKLSYLFSRKSFNFLTYKFVLSVGLAVLVGYQIGYWDLGSAEEPLAVKTSVKTPVSVSQEHQLINLAKHIGRFEANLMRINALGER